MMKALHIVVPDLFLPGELAADVGAGLHLPVLEKIMARGDSRPLALTSLEAWLCSMFGVPEAAIAPVTLRADGVPPEQGYWLRADPVHLRLEREQMILQTNVAPSSTEAAVLCAYLNAHFADSGMRFFAPHPQRWYVRLDEAPDLETYPVSQVEGRNARSYMPQGGQALQWHGILNEIQMALYAHPLSEASAQQGILAVNSVWLWGGGYAAELTRVFDRLYGGCELAQAFARAVQIPCVPDFPASPLAGGRSLYVWDGLNSALRRGDFYAWRESLLALERDCLSPALDALRAGDVGRITLDVLQEEGSRRYELSRAMLWRVWRRAQPLARQRLV